LDSKISNVGVSYFRTIKPIDSLETPGKTISLKV
jgi:hypothetical protein